MVTTLPFAFAVVDVSDASEPKTPANTDSPGVKPIASMATADPGSTRLVEMISLTTSERTSFSLGEPKKAVVVDTTDEVVVMVDVVDVAVEATAEVEGAAVVDVVDVVGVSVVDVADASRVTVTL